MEKAECGQFSILSFLLQESQTTVKAVMEETGFSKATLTKYVTLLNDKALDSGLELTIHSEDENLRCKFVCGAEIGLGSLGSHQSTTSSGQCLSVSSHRRENARVF